MNPVAARFRAERDHRISDPSRCTEENLVLVRNAMTDHIHERILRVNIVEDDFASDRRHTHTIPICTYSSHHTLEQVSIFFLF